MFTEHIDYIIKKVGKRIGAMYRSKNLLPIKYRKMFANALMLPQFDYLDIIYNRAGKSKLKELDILYKKVAKIALGVSTRESSITVYKDMEWLPLHLRRQLHLSAYMFRIINNISPSNFMNKFKFISGGTRDGLYGKKFREPIMPYLKRLHFLPVKYRIKFKVALLVFKCLNGFAPAYMQELISTREIKRRSSRLDEDFFMLATQELPKSTRTDAAFSYYGPCI